MGTSESKVKEEEVFINNNAAGTVMNNVEKELNYKEISIIIVAIVIMQIAVHYIKKYFSKAVSKEVTRINV